jgi:hypothetical protein
MEERLELSERDENKFIQYDSADEGELSEEDPQYEGIYEDNAPIPERDQNQLSDEDHENGAETYERIVENDEVFNIEEYGSSEMDQISPRKKRKVKKKRSSKEKKDYHYEGGSRSESQSLSESQSQTIEEVKIYEGGDDMNPTDPQDDRMKNQSMNEEEKHAPMSENELLDAQKAQQEQMDQIDDEERAYNPTYSVFHTEARFLKSGVYMPKKDPWLVDDFYLDNIKAKDTVMISHRTRRLVPPRQIDFTEEDEKRLREFEQKVNKDNIRAEPKQVNENVGQLDEQIKRIDTKKMNKVEIETLRERETVAYFRKNMRAKMQVIDVRAIEFDWLFSKDGATFLSHISKSDSIELFSLEIIRIIIRFFWGYYVNRIIIASLIPFLFYFVIFIVYASYISFEDDLKDDIDPNWNFVSDIFKYVIAV